MKIYQGYNKTGEFDYIDSVNKIFYTHKNKIESVRMAFDKDPMVNHWEIKDIDDLPDLQKRNTQYTSD